MPNTYGHRWIKELREVKSKKGGNNLTKRKKKVLREKRIHYNPNKKDIRRNVCQCVKEKQRSVNARKTIRYIKQVIIKITRHGKFCHYPDTYKEKHQSMISRFRCRSKKRVNYLWSKDEDTKFRMCKEIWNTVGGVRKRRKKKRIDETDNRKKKTIKSSSTVSFVSYDLLGIHQHYKPGVNEKIF